MANVSKAFSIVMVIVFVAIFERASQASEFDVGEIRAATSKLVDALGDPDPTAWVYMYTEDARSHRAISRGAELSRTCTAAHPG
jgi:hypothetical protein